tara:strand:- start:321 stop:857 length:537 start_codon:yes stop_codon:yes gene_type:complete
MNSKPLKIGICGKMGSGKTSLANEIVKTNSNGTVLSLAGEVKHIARRLFGMEGKDRSLLQQIGMKMREIEPDVWIDYLLRESNNSYLSVLVVDDVRFINEVDKFRQDGFVMIKITIDEEHQLERIKSTYPDDWERHWEKRHNPSESEIDEIPDWWFDFIVSAKELEEGWDLPRLFKNN